MTAQTLIAVHEERTDSRLYFVPRDGHVVKRYWKQLSDQERKSQIAAEERAAYVALFNIY